MATITSMSELDKIVEPRVRNHPRSLTIIDRQYEEVSSGTLEFDGWWWDERHNRLVLTVQFLATQSNDGYGIQIKRLQGRSYSFDLTDATFEGFTRPWMERVVVTTPRYEIIVYLPMPLSG